MNQKFKQYKMAESEKSVLFPPLSYAPRFDVSKGSHFLVPWVSFLQWL